MYVDISSISTPSYGGQKHWILFVDDYTDCCFSKFVPLKSIMPTIALKVLHELANKGIWVQTIRCDNSGENNKFAQLCQNFGLPVRFKFTAPGTPQQNGRVERKFATLTGMVRSMLNAARFDKKHRYLMWAECANTATDIHNIILKTADSPTPYKAFNGLDAPYARHLCTFGEIGVAKEHDTVHSKLDDRDTTCVFVGYATDHAGDVYRMLSLRTHKLRFSCDVI
jgi:hypothetical protein